MGRQFFTHWSKIAHWRAGYSEFVEFILHLRSLTWGKGRLFAWHERRAKHKWRKDYFCPWTQQNPWNVAVASENLFYSIVFKTWLTEQQTINNIPVCRAVAKSLANSALRELVITVSIQRTIQFICEIMKHHAGTNAGSFRRFPPIKWGIGQKQKSENFEYLCYVFSWALWQSYSLTSSWKISLLRERWSWLSML